MRQLLLGAAALLLAVPACGGGGSSDKRVGTGDLGGCVVIAEVTENSPVPRRVLQADADVKAFEYVSAGQPRFDVYPSRPEVVSALETRLGDEPGVTRVADEGCPTRAREGGSATYSVDQVVAAFREAGLPVLGSKTASKSIVPSAPVTALVPRDGGFVVMVANSPDQAHSLDKLFTVVSAAGTFDAQNGNVFVLSSGSGPSPERAAADQGRAEVARLGRRLAVAREVLEQV